MFELDEDIYDETKIEEIELNCPWTIISAPGACHVFMITKLGWSFQHPFGLTAHIYPIDKPAHPILPDIKRKTLAFAKLLITLTIYKRYPEPHLTQLDIHILRGLMDTAEFQMGIHTSYYTQKRKNIVQKQSNRKSSFLVVPAFNLYSWWCQSYSLIFSYQVHLLFLASGASSLLFPLVVPVTFTILFFSGAITFHS